MVREAKILRATTKKISRHFLRKHVPQSERFRFVFSRSQVIEVLDQEIDSREVTLEFLPCKALGVGVLAALPSAEHRQATLWPQHSRTRSSRQKGGPCPCPLRTAQGCTAGFGPAGSRLAD
ncbi:DUF1661 domain-containing protein [Porphyromonas gingivalis]|nr:DUF1661 domain-containing protein [Porphyromonas gingivalis]MCE8180602.1 DUF1661 domain-containing protein [Porphyromonas gingivalis]HBW78103.1 DUF1661 domain-containing protein [Porphyromonas gingivalis]